MRVIKTIVLIPLALALVVLAVANRQDVVLVLDPFGLYEPFTHLVMPLYMLLFIVAALGVLAGGLGAWWSQRAARERARAAIAEREGRTIAAWPPDDPSQSVEVSPHLPKCARCGA